MHAESAAKWVNKQQAWLSSSCKGEGSAQLGLKAYHYSSQPSTIAGLDWTSGLTNYTPQKRSRMPYTEPAFTASLHFCDVSGRPTMALDLTQACRDLEKNLQGGRSPCILHTVCQLATFFSHSIAATLRCLWTAKPSSAFSSAARE